MHGESGQASVEWVGALLLVAIALGALARLSDRVDSAGLATAGLRATECALAGCDGRVAPYASGPGHRSSGPGARAVTPPPLLPLPLGGTPADARGEARAGARGDARAGARGARSRRPSLRLTNPVPPRVRARFGAVWRRAWMACFAYERIRYGMLHPEDHRQVVPLREVVRMTNDCLSPFDLSRDWEHLQP